MPSTQSRKNLGHSKKQCRFSGNGLRVKTPRAKTSENFSEDCNLPRRFRRYPETLWNPVKVISAIFWGIFWNIFCEHFFLPRSFQKFLPFAFLPSGSFRIFWTKKPMTARDVTRFYTFSPPRNRAIFSTLTMNDDFYHPSKETDMSQSCRELSWHVINCRDVFSRSLPSVLVTFADSYLGRNDLKIAEERGIVFGTVETGRIAKQGLSSRTRHFY